MLCPAGEARRWATVKEKQGKLIIEFYTDLYFDSGGKGENIIKRKNEQPIVFEYNGQDFIIKK